jgi:uncharacterized protein YjdB
MKKTFKFIGVIVLAAVIGLILTGCAGFIILGGSGSDTVTIRANNNLSTVSRGGTLRFIATGRDIIWIVSSTRDGSGPVTSGTSINNGVLIVSINETYTILYVIVTSSSSGQSEYKEIRVATVTGVTVTPVNQSVAAGKSIQFNASVTGNNNPDNIVSWSVSSNPAGTGAVTQGTAINANGVLTVALRETFTTLFVKATSVVDPSISAAVPVTILIPTVTSVTVSPSNQSTAAGRTLQFNASVLGTNNPVNEVTWKVSSNAAGTGAVAQGTAINARGILTIAPGEKSTALYITATSIFDTSKSGSAVVSVIIPIVTSVTVSPSNQSMARGTSVQFTASVSGSNNPSNAVTWKVSSNSAGTGAVTSGTGINNNGLLTVSANETSAILYILATSVTDTTKSGSAVVSVIIPTVTSVIISPSNQSVERGRTVQFTASVSGSNNPSNAVTRKVSSSSSGTGAVISGTSINANGLLTVSANETAATLYITATSTVDSTKSASAVVTVNIPPVVTPPAVTPPVTTPPPVTPTVTSVIVSPSNQSLERGKTLQFSASVTGTNNPSNAVTWKVSSNSAGTGAVTSGTGINAGGLLTVSANENVSTLYVIATSAADTTKSGSTTVTITRSDTGNQNSQGQNQNS